MAITNVNGPKELRKKLSKKLKKFMEEGKTFNVQGSWTGDDGVTVTVLMDFGVQHPCDGEGYIGSVMAPFEENLKYLEKKTSLQGGSAAPGQTSFGGGSPLGNLSSEELRRALGDSDTFYEAEQAMMSAVGDVFSVSMRGMEAPPEVSDIDVVSSIRVDYSRWPVHSDIDRIDCGNEGNAIDNALGM